MFTPGFRGGFMPGFRGGFDSRFGRFDRFEDRFERRFFTPGFDRLEDRFERRSFTPGLFDPRFLMPGFRPNFFMPF
jgi:hypothetical protein